jgi:hypothetical protein
MPAGARREPNQVGNRILTGGYQVWTSQKGHSQAEPGAAADKNGLVVAACLGTPPVVITPRIRDLRR